MDFKAEPELGQSELSEVKGPAALDDCRKQTWESSGGRRLARVGASSACVDAGRFRGSIVLAWSEGGGRAFV